MESSSTQSAAATVAAALAASLPVDPMASPAEDALEGLRAYWASNLDTMTPSWAEAASRQARPGAAEAGLDLGLADPMDEIGSLGARLEFVADLMSKAAVSTAPCVIALQTTWAGDAWGLRRELLPWCAWKGDGQVHEGLSCVE
jgi:hypothetical protein